jgi:hypothetical protein
MTNDVGDDMLNSLLEVQRTMSTELLQASTPPAPSTIIIISDPVDIFTVLSFAIRWGIGTLRSALSEV